MNCTQCNLRREHILNTDPTHLIPSICEQFYHLGWVTGTGGSISMRDREGKTSEGKDVVYITPSGVHKERILPEHLFCTATDDEKDVICSPPAHCGYRMSQCTPLFYCAYNQRNAGAVIHTHSISANILTVLLEKSSTPHEFRITHQEMIKGIKVGDEPKYHKYYDTLVIPVIENTPDERDLRDSMSEAMKKYPHTNAILVRRHGIYVWGSTWEEAKSMAECYDYLLGVGVDMLKMNLVPDEIPAQSPYREQSTIYGPL